jgi:hypothetical protein
MWGEPSRSRGVTAPRRTVHVVVSSSARGYVRALVVLLIGVHGASVAPPANAALWLELDPTSGPPGTEVRGRTGGNGAFPQALAGREFRLWMLDAALDVGSADRDSLVPVGSLRVNADGDGVRCVPCAPFSGGRRLLPVGEFVVEERPRIAEDLTPPGPSGWAMAGTAGTVLAVVVIGAAIFLRSRRSRA